MPYIVCAEEIDRRWIAHVPDLPGCFTTHDQRDQAINLIPKAIESYVAWAADHSFRISGLSGPMLVSEVIRAWRYEDDYEVNAFFAADRPPLMSDEMDEFEQLLLACRADLQATLEGLETEDMDQELSGDWSIARVLNHVAMTEQWYFDRMGIGLPSGELPQSPLERLVRVRENTLARLPDLGKRVGVVTLSGETWSARKVMRRTLWHERDHTEHMHKLRRRLG